MRRPNEESKADRLLLEEEVRKTQWKQGDTQPELNEESAPGCKKVAKACLLSRKA